MSKTFHRLRRRFGKYIIPDVLKEVEQDKKLKIAEAKRECKEEKEQYKKRIDEYVDHFMRCKIEKVDRSMRLRLHLEYDAEPFFFTNQYYGADDNSHRSFMAREIAYRVEKEVYAARIANAPPRREFISRVPSDMDEGADYNSLSHPSLPLPSNPCPPPNPKRQSTTLPTLKKRGQGIR